MRKFMVLVAVLPALACTGLVGVTTSTDVDGSTTWADRYRATKLDQESGNLWFARDGNWVYGRDVNGQFYVVTMTGPVPVAGLPCELATWPGMTQATGLQNAQRVTEAEDSGETEPPAITTNAEILLD